MSRVNDGVKAAGYTSLKEYHDSVGVTGGDSWWTHYSALVPSATTLGDAMAEFWDTGPSSSTGPAVGDGMLLENVDFLLLETGDYLLLE